MRGSIHGSLHPASTSRSQKGVETGENASIELDERTTGTTGIAEVGNPDGHVQDGRRRVRVHPRSDVSSTCLERLKRWWSQKVSLTLEHDNNTQLGGDPRDFLALERTFLSWFRTSSALVSLGVVITQLFILRDLDPAKGKILGTVLAVGGIASLLLGCIRYFRQQAILAHGKTLAGGWHVTVMLALLGLTILTLFIVILIED